MNPPQLQPCDVLAIGPHPDDIEIATAGTLLLLIASGHGVSLLDCTRGEMGSRGSAAERATEAAAAAARLGVRQRVGLGLPDTGVRVDDASTDLLVAALRAARPALLLAPHARDVHPDHSATAQLTERAFFLAGLRNHQPQLGAPHRPRLFLRYPGNLPVEPSLLVDISSVAAAKAEVVRCYRSQLAPPDRSHIVQGLDLLERAEVRDRFYGARRGVFAAESFWHDGPVPIGHPGSLLRP
ncbi:MAG TPA: bacillithiol biosynthesis deacetylase BshB1 [Planctomycetota bacterium]|nr:bacillithiol biosynthesis deacetylase BshB1 [Planctomycetota bacterium]